MGDVSPTVFLSVSPELKADLAAALAGGFDILHLEQLWCAWLGLEHPERALVNVHHLCWLDLEHIRPANWWLRFERWLMMRTERRVIRRVRHVRSCSPRLAPEIQKENAATRVVTIPVGIDPTQYEYIPEHRRTAAPVLSLMGNMGWYPSHSAAVRLLTRLWPRIKKQAAEARVQIVGWRARTALKDYLEMPDVTIEENVPDMRPYFERTGVMLYAPGRGSGMKIKILEALAYGVPVVTTSEGVEGLPAEDGVHAGVAEEDAGLIERAVHLLRNPATQNRQRMAGRMLLERHCGPTPTLNALENAYANMLECSCP